LFNVHLNCNSTGCYFLALLLQNAMVKILHIFFASEIFLNKFVPLSFRLPVTRRDFDHFLVLFWQNSRCRDCSRYPADPYDRIWESDLDRRANFLVAVKVMQTAVIGTGGSISYRLNLEDFPANARAYVYFAEIEDLRMNNTRKFKMELPYMPDYSNAIVNIAENANGSYTLYEPSYMNVSLDFVLTCECKKTRDSTRGPLLNAMEISRYVEIAAKTDEKDGKKVTGEIPREVNSMGRLTELWLDGNSFIGTIPDMSDLVNLKILHLENNQLTGSLPSYLGKLPYLQELYVQNNSLSGEIPSPLLRGNLTFRFVSKTLECNPHLKQATKKRNRVILGASIGIVATHIVLSTLSILLLRRSRPLSGYSIARDEGVAYYIPLSDLEEATNNFSKKIGKGSFGPVYYGKLMDGKEVAVKTMADSSSHGTKQLITEVALLSRIHHRNLVPLIGYCEEEHQRMLVYEYMHNGTLRDHLNGLEYLHTGCNPSIINRDVKTSNSLLDINMRAKVSDFGLSRQAEEDLTHVSSVARGTVGYLDPEYYPNQQLTEKSDPGSTEEYGSDWSIVHWARALIRKGDVISITDPTLIGTMKVESVWRIAEVSIQCVEQHSTARPRMQEIILAVQDAIKIEKETDKLDSIESSKGQSSRNTLLTSFLDIQSPDLSNGSLVPSAI
ncbi:hypothetical protein MIMGU_mgv1a020891mg, partial [Erythranthe guttata]